MKKSVNNFGSKLFVTILFTCILLVLIEGISSTIIFVGELIKNRSHQLAERLHSEYDRDLGWINVKNKVVKDIYGPGKSLRINSQSFRSDKDFTVGVPQDKIRIICSGDSFTFGYGVANEYTWCNQLTKLNSRIETINMGQGGYGIDQAYLWYMRDGIKFDHDIHIFAFVSLDFTRLLQDNFSGYGKPLLKVENGKLAIHNVPVPKVSPVVNWFANNRKQIEGLRLSQLFRKYMSASVPAPEDGILERVTANIFFSLNDVNMKKRSALYLVYLPTLADYDSNSNDMLRAWLAGVCRENKLNFIDLTDDLRKYPVKIVDEMFIPYNDILNYPSAAGHYSEKGNRFVAESLYKILFSVPENSVKLSKRSMMTPSQKPVLPMWRSVFPGIA